MMTKNNNIVARRIHGSSFLIDISDNYLGDRCALYEVNETGMFIWNNIKANCTIDDVAALLKQAIVDDVDYQILYEDVTEFIDILVKKHFMEM
jgi:hypothetical protein